MINQIKCKVCKGVKKILGLGLIYKDCKTCNGTGKVEVETEVHAANTAIEKTPEMLVETIQNVEPIVNQSPKIEAVKLSRKPRSTKSLKRLNR